SHFGSSSARVFSLGPLPSLAPQRAPGARASTMEAASQNDAETGVQRRVFVAVCVTWFVSGGCVLLARTARQVRHGSHRSSFASCFGQLFGLRRRLEQFLAGTVDHTSARQVAQELQTKRLVHARASVAYGCVAVAGALGLGLYRTAIGVSRPNSCVQDMCQSVGFCIVLFLWAFPQSLTLRTLDLWSSLLMALVVLWVSPLASADVVVASSSLLPFGATLVLCLFSMNFRLNITCLWSVSLSICSTIYLGTENPVEEFLPDRTQRVTQVLVATCIFAVLVTIFHQSVYLVVQYDMEANISRNELKAARSVLRGVCDAVVELDSDFRLQDGSSELVSMLLLNPLRPVLGEDFRQFLASQHDREKFSEQIGRALPPSEDSVGPSAEDSVGLSAAFHVSMRDSSSIALEVEMFCVRFVKREGQTAHFIGIREFTDIAPMLRGSVSERTRRGGSVSGPQSSCTALVRLPAAPADSTAEASGQASSDVSSEASSLDEKWEGLGAEAEPVAWVDLLTPTYEVRLETFAFTKYVDARGGLLSAVRQSQWEEFIVWAQLSYCSLLQEGSDSAYLQYPKRLRFRSPAQQRSAHSSRSSGQMLSARLRLDLERPPDGQDRGRGVVRVVLQDLLLRRRAPPGPRRLSRYGTPTAIAQAASGQLLAQEQISRSAAQTAALAGGAAARPEAADGHVQLQGPVSRPPSCDPAARPSQAVTPGADTRSL
ncbi:unnamed protein product, partial [Prorocentrum cordatum]